MPSFRQPLALHVGLMMRLPRAISILTMTSLLVLAGCPDEQHPGQAGAAAFPPPQVAVITAAAEDVPITNELPGRIAATRVAEVRPRISGILVERVFEQGSMVKEGDVLYRIHANSETGLGFARDLAAEHSAYELAQ